MSAHIEWLAARETSLQVFTPGEDWVGAGEHRQVRGVARLRKLYREIRGEVLRLADLLQRRIDVASAESGHREQPGDETRRA